MAIDFSFRGRRHKGPPTPNLGLLSEMLHFGRTGRLRFDWKTAEIQHSGVGMKVAFVCDVLDKIEELSGIEIKAFLKEDTLMIDRKLESVSDELVLNLDVFVFELYSVLDYIAVELQEIFGLKVTKKGKKRKTKPLETFMELKHAIGLNREIRNAVESLEKQPWFTYFHAIRTRITHRMPINPQARFVVAEDIVRQFHFCCLPDDPKAPYPTFEKKIDIVCESKKWLEGVLGFTEGVCKVLIGLMSM